MGKSKIKKVELVDIAARYKRVKLDVGCGTEKKEGFIGIDNVTNSGVDYIVDLEKEKIPLPKNSVDQIFTSHFLEHVNNPKEVLEEFNRVLKQSGRLIIIVPHYTNPYAYHFTHKTYWSSFSLDQNYLDYYLNTNLVLQSKKIKICLFKAIDPLLTLISNYSLSMYERLFSRIFHAWEIEFILEKDLNRNKNKNISNLH